MAVKGKNSGKKENRLVTSIFSLSTISFNPLPDNILDWSKLKYSGISLVRSTRDRDFLYGLNVVRTKKCDCVQILLLPYADLFDRIDVACLIVPPIWGWYRGHFQIYTAPSHKYSAAGIFDGF